MGPSRWVWRAFKDVPTAAKGEILGQAGIAGAARCMGQSGRRHLVTSAACVAGLPFPAHAPCCTPCSQLSAFRNGSGLPQPARQRHAKSPTTCTWRCCPPNPATPLCCPACNPRCLQVDALVHQFKGSSASFGAHTMAGLCVQLRDACHAHNQPACQALVAQLRQSFALLKARLEQFMALETQRKQLSGGR